VPLTGPRCQPHAPTEWNRHPITKPIAAAPGPITQSAVPRGAETLRKPSEGWMRSRRLLCPGSIATATPQAFTMASPPERLAGYGVSHPPGREDGRALHPGPYPPGLSRCHAYGALPPVPVRMPSGLACRTRTIWQSWHVPALSALLPPSPAPPGSGCAQLLPGRCDSPARRPSTSFDSQRLTAHQRLVAHSRAIGSGSPAGCPGVSQPQWQGLVRLQALLPVDLRHSP
jgi:hypothetical protein